MNREPMEKLAAELGGNVFIFTGNLTKTEDVEKLIDDAEAQMGKVDVITSYSIHYTKLYD